MHNISSLIIIVVGSLAAVGCKSSEAKQGPQPVTEHVKPLEAVAAQATPPTAPASAEIPVVEPAADEPAPPGAPAPTLVLRRGETLVPEGDLTAVGDNPMIWRPTPSEAVTLAFVFEGERARAVMIRANAPRTELGRVEFDTAYSATYATVDLGDGTVALVFISTGGSGDPGFTAGWRLRWDAKTRAPVIAAKGNWSHDDIGDIASWADLPDPAL